MEKHLQHIVVCVLLLSQFLYSASFSNKYDLQIYVSVKRYWIDFPQWKWWKAQLYQESRLKNHAVSPVGASGLAQFMPKTWKQMQNRLGYDKSSTPFDSNLAINAGAYYMWTLRKQWSWKRPLYDKHFLALASYNAGLGSILKAQKACNNAVLYEDIMECLPQITGHHSKETITYKKRIELWYSKL